MTFRPRMTRNRTTSKPSATPSANRSLRPRWKKRPKLLRRRTSKSKRIDATRRGLSDPVFHWYFRKKTATLTPHFRRVDLLPYNELSHQQITAFAPRKIDYV